MYRITDSQQPHLLGGQLRGNAAHALIDVVERLPEVKLVLYSTRRPVLTLCVQKSLFRPIEGAASKLTALCVSDHADLISIFFCCFCIVTVFGSVIVSTPFEKSAAILSRSTLAGSSNERWNDP